MSGNKVPTSGQAPSARAATSMYSVLVIDNFAVPDPDAARLIHGFTTWEAAVLYARRRTWDSVEEFRRPGSDVRAEFLRFGESCSASGALGEEKTYRARDELDYFLAHPASKEQRDWSSLTPKSDK